LQFFLIYWPCRWHSNLPETGELQREKGR